MSTPLNQWQHRVGDWVQSRFGIDVLQNRRERAARVLEEAIELAQAEGMRISEVINVAGAVYAKPPGESLQEAAGVGVTLLAWAESRMVSLSGLIYEEIERIESKPVEHFRQRQQAKADAGIAMAPR